MTPTPRHPRLAGLAASLAIGVLLVGLPAVLVALGWGSLPPGDWRTWLTTPDDGRLTLLVLKGVAWIVWALLLVVIGSEIAALARGRRAVRLPGLRWSQPAARRLVATAVLLFTAIPATVNVASAAPATAAPTSPTTSTSAAPTTTSAADTLRATDAQEAVRTHMVRAGDSLWSIAERYLGSGLRYPEIARLNTQLLGGHDDFLRPGWVLTLPAETSVSYTVQPGDTLSSIARTHLGDETAWPRLFDASRDTRQPDGQRLTDPDLILPGWTITIPTTSAATSSGQTPAEQARTTASGEPRTEPTTAPGTPTPPTANAPTASNEPAVAAASPAGEPTPATATVKPQTPEGTPTVPAAQPPTAEEGTTGQADSGPSWLLPGLSGAGVLLSAGLFVTLQRRRRAQFRARRPGRTIALPPRELAPVEKTIRRAADAVATVDFLDRALRHLATATPDGQVPALRAVEVLPGRLAVHLAHPADVTGPWQHADGAPDGTRWTLPADTNLPDPACRAPYPLLVTLGRDDAGATWLLNLEHLATATLTGDPTRAADFARYLAAGIAVNPWSREARLHCVGIAAELADLDPARLHHHPDPEAAARRLAGHAVETIERCDDLRVDDATGRATDLGDDLWPAWILLNAGDPEPLDQLTDLLRRNTARTATAVVVLGDPTPPASGELHFTDQGRVTVPDLGLDLDAVGLTEEEARGCAQLLALADDPTDTPMPHDEGDGWHEAADAAGALRDDLVLPRDTDTDTLTEPADTALPVADDTLADLPATADELATLAPLVPAHVRTRIEASDDQLDADVAAWFDPHRSAPRLSLLGPVHATVGPGGNPKAAGKRPQYYTEILAFLALHPTGVSMDQLLDAFIDDEMQMRKHLSVLRDWLGSDPTTGEPYLPSARKSPNAQVRGKNVYQLLGVLIDIDLFKRLRLRGEAKASDGLPDLQRALQLVEGEPFTGLRNGGWDWLIDGVRHDQHMICAVVDVAHTVTLAALHRGDLPAARTAAETAIHAAPYEDTPQVDLAAVLAREGDPDAARQIVNDVCNRPDDEDGPTDLAHRTDQLLRDPRWLTATGKVA